MGSLSRLIKEKGGELGEARGGQVRVQQIHYTKLKESALNFYTRSDKDVEELADTMLIAGGILQPLIVRKTDMSEYEILAGHKRRRASVYNVERGYKEFEFLPCIVVDMGGLMAKKISERILAGQDGIGDDRLLDMIAEYIVICTNSTASESSSYEKMMQAVRLSEILPAMLENEELKGRALRAEIAKELKCGDGQVGRYQSIYNNLVPEAMERFRDNKMTFSTACALAGLDHDQQYAALEKQQITVADIEHFKQERNRETVSNMDTEKDQKGSGETVSNMDTDNGQSAAKETAADDGYKRISDTKEDIYRVFSLTFDASDSGFPQEVTKELISFMETTGTHVSILTDIFDKALPFENDQIRIERIYGYSIYFKETHEKMTVALWPFWNVFIGKYHFGEDKAAGCGKSDQTDGDIDESSLAAGADEENKTTAASERTETVQSYSVGYTMEDVRQIRNEQISIIQQIERIKKFGDLSEEDERQYGKARIIRDGMTYILEAFKEGTIC